MDISLFQVTTHKKGPRVFEVWKNASSPPIYPRMMPDSKQSLQVQAVLAELALSLK